MISRTGGRTTRSAARETVAQHGDETVDKISVSLPPGLVARAREEATRDDTSVSAVVAKALHERFSRQDQVRLDAALDADREESLHTAEAFRAYATALLAEAEW